ncbi:hypothetical protein BC830DRAFT_914630 [Chytriomyces sp. MP71]|nr:hypothetical protein BC830DRAFT_914630 [Chytriomyces sp. MP71]
MRVSEVVSVNSSGTTAASVVAVASSDGGRRTLVAVGSREGHICLVSTSSLRAGLDPAQNYHQQSYPEAAASAAPAVPENIVKILVHALPSAAFAPSSSHTATHSHHTQGSRVAVSAIAHSPVAQRLVSAAEDGSLVVWDTFNSLFLRCHSVQRAHASAISAIVFDPATVSPPKIDTNYTTPQAQKLRHRSSLYEVSNQGVENQSATKMHHNNTPTIYTASFDKHIHIWDISIGKRIGSMPQGHMRPILALSLQGTCLYSSSMDGDVRIYDIMTRECLRVLRMVASPSPTLSASGLAAANLPAPIAASTAAAAIGSVQSGNEVLAIAAGINVVYAGARDGTVRVWNVSSGKLVKVLGGGISGGAASTLSLSSSIASVLGGLVGLDEEPLSAPAAATMGDVVGVENPILIEEEETGYSPPKRASRMGSPTSLVEAVIAPIQRRASNLVLAEQFVQSAGSILKQTLFGDAGQQHQGSGGGSHSAVRTVCVGVVPGQIFVAGDDAVIYEWDVKSGTVVGKFDSHSAGILWLCVERSGVDGGGKLFSASLDGCIRMFDIEPPSPQFQAITYTRPPRVIYNKGISRRTSAPVLSITQKQQQHQQLIPAPYSSPSHRPSPPGSPLPTVPYRSNSIATPPGSYASSDYNSAMAEKVAQDSQTIATLRAQLDRAHALLSTQSQLTHRLKSELTVTRSHIATIKSDLSTRQAEVAQLRAAGLERQVKRLEQEARDGRDAALVALEYITRQGTAVGLEIEVEVMGVMRLLESPWTPLHADGEGLSGRVAKPAVRFWESDSEFDSDLDVDLDETDAWWRTMPDEAAEARRKEEMAAAKKQENERLETLHKKATSVTFKVEVETSSSENGEGTEEDDEGEDTLGDLLPRTTPSSERKKKGAHRWSTLSLTRPVLAYHENFRNSTSPENSGSDDTEDEGVAPLTSAITKRRSIITFQDTPPNGGLQWSKGFLERIPEDLTPEDVYLARASKRRSLPPQINMIAMGDLESSSSAEDLRIQRRKGGSREYTAFDPSGTWPVSPVLDTDDADTERLAHIGIPTPSTQQNDSAVNLVDDAMKKADSAVKWHLQQQQRVEEPVLDEELSTIVWNGNIKKQHQAPVQQLAPLIEEEPAAIVWSGPVRSPKSSAKNTVASEGMDDPEAILFAGPVKSKKADLAPTLTAMSEELGDAESILWQGNVKSKKGTKKKAKSAAAESRIDLEGNGADEIGDAESVLFTGRVKSKKGTAKKAKSIVAESQIDEEAFDVDDAESVVFRGTVKSKKLTSKMAKSVAAESNADEDAFDIDDAESVVFKGKVKSKKGMAKKAKSIAAESHAGMEEEGFDIDDAESIVFRGAVRSKKSTAKKAKSITAESHADEAHFNIDDAESVVFKGPVKSKKGAAKKAKSAAAESAQDYDDVSVAIDDEDAESVVFRGPVKSKKAMQQQALSVNESIDEAESILFRGSVKPSQKTTKSASVTKEGSLVESIEDAESIVWNGSVKSGGKATSKAGKSAARSVVGDFSEGEAPPLPPLLDADAQAVMWNGSIKSNRPAVPRPTIPTFDLESSSEKPIIDEALEPLQPSEFVMPKLKPALRTSLVPPAREPMPELNPGVLKPLRSTSNASVSNVVTSPSTNGIKVSLKSSIKNQSESEVEQIDSGFGDFAKVPEQAPFGKGTLKTTPRPGPASISTNSVLFKVASPAEVPSPSSAPVPANQVKQKSSWLFSPISSIMQAVADQFVPESEEPSLSQVEPNSAKKEVKGPIANEVTADRGVEVLFDVGEVIDDERASTRSSISIKSLRRSQSLDLSHLRFQQSQEEERPVFARRHSFHIIDFRSILFDNSPLFEDYASEAGSYNSSIGPKSSVFTAPVTEDEDRPLTPTRTTNSSSYDELKQEVTASNNRIKKRGSVSSALHANNATTSSGTFKRPSLRPAFEEEEIVEEMVIPAVDKLAAAFESALEAAIERPWSLVPKWLVIDDSQPTQVQK